MRTWPLLLALAMLALVAWLTFFYGASGPVRLGIGVGAATVSVIAVWYERRRRATSAHAGR